MSNIESFLSARLFIQPQLVDNFIYFMSNMSGHLSLYRMKFGGSIPQPLLPSKIALQNPHILEGKSFYVFPKINIIVVMIDNNGDENYKPMAIPLTGGFPYPLYQSPFENSRIFLGHCDSDSNYFFVSAARHDKAIYESYRCNLESSELIKLAEGPWGKRPIGVNKTNQKVILEDSYSIGDSTLYLWSDDQPGEKILLGTPLEQRYSNMDVQLNGISFPHFIANDQAILFCTTLFEDEVGLGYIDLDKPQNVKPVKIQKLQHSGQGELTRLYHIKNNRFVLEYNVDGSSWLYEGEFQVDNLEFLILNNFCGKDSLSAGVIESFSFDTASNRFVISFSSAVSPTQIYTIEGQKRDTLNRHSDETILGIPIENLSPGEDASYNSFDGLRISARLYFPSGSLNYKAPFPLVYYIHGGPQSQERPDFAWFSMPLIQFLTLKGFAVFVPNVRGSTGYGLSYTKHVDKDWGGKDRQDHVFAMDEILPKDTRLDTSRVGVVGRSYGGYMSLTLASRHPDLWSAAVDMFGPNNLLTFCERIPATWKPYYNLVLGDPQNPSDCEFMRERSPQTYIQYIKCPLLVIQGKNDPRVVERESNDLVNYLRSQGKQVDYLVFENEGHDVLKYENRVQCYNAITDFFVKYLNHS